MSFPWPLILLLLVACQPVIEPQHHVYLAPEQPTIEQPITVSMKGNLFKILVLNVWNETVEAHPVIDSCNGLSLTSEALNVTIQAGETKGFNVAVIVNGPSTTEDPCFVRILTAERELARYPIELEVS